MTNLLEEPTLSSINGKSVDELLEGKILFTQDTFMETVEFRVQRDDCTYLAAIKHIGEDNDIDDIELFIPLIGAPLEMKIRAQAIKLNMLDDDSNTQSLF